MSLPCFELTSSQITTPVSRFLVSVRIIDAGVDGLLLLYQHGQIILSVNLKMPTNSSPEGAAGARGLGEAGRRKFF